ncbi:MAG: sugar phosphate isomerase/epimerase family protein [Planctomycetota bacterium]
MKLAICNETFGDMPLANALNMAREAGYTGWEVAPFTLFEDIESFSAADRKDYRQKVEDSGLTIIGLHWLLAKTEGFHLTTMDDQVRRRTRDYFLKLIDLCGDLGGELMVLGSPGQRNFPEQQGEASAMEMAADCLSGITGGLDDQNVFLALEALGPEEGNFLNTADLSAELAQMIGHPKVGLHLDVKAMSADPAPTTEVIRKHAHHTFHFHANDPNRRGPGMGDVDFVPIYEALLESGYDRWVSVEVFDYSPGVEKLVCESADNLRAAGF